MSSKRMQGICKLSGDFGIYVDSHLIPLALTRLSSTGEKYVEPGIGRGIKNRSNSWYDRQLVTRAGEDILAAIDDHGIRILRRHRLVWSAWGLEEPLAADDFQKDGDGCQTFRLVRIDEARHLQLFFLSLLWRAAASTREEFSDVCLSENLISQLRQRIVAGDPGSFGDFPVQLFQVVTRGPGHNRTPLMESKNMPLLEGGWGQPVEYVRFYFDGLVSHVHLPSGKPFAQEYLDSSLGTGRDTIVFTHEFQNSRTAHNLAEMLVTVDTEHLTVPGRLAPVAAVVQATWPGRRNGRTV